MKYEIGLQIGDLKLIEYTPIINGHRKYIFQCSCKNKIQATTTSVKRMYTTLALHNYVGCMNCIRKTKAQTKVALGGEYKDIYNRYKKGAKNRKIS